MANIGNSKGFSFNYKYTKEKAGFYSQFVYFLLKGILIFIFFFIVGRNSPDKAAQEKSAEKNAAGVGTLFCA